MGQAIAAALVLITASAVFGLVAVAIVIAPILAEAYNRLEGEPANPYPMEPEYVVPIIACTTVAISAALLLAKLFRWASRTGNSRRSEFEASSKTGPASIERWNQLFYCYRCDGVLIPGADSGLMPTWFHIHLGLAQKKWVWYKYSRAAPRMWCGTWGKEKRVFADTTKTP